MSEVEKIKFVVMLDKDNAVSSSDLIKQFESIQGLEIISGSRSFIDLVVAKDAVDMTEVMQVVKVNGAELHSLAMPELIEPIKPPKLEDSKVDSD